MSEEKKRKQVLTALILTAPGSLTSQRMVHAMSREKLRKGLRLLDSLQQEINQDPDVWKAMRDLYVWAAPLPPIPYASCIGL